VALVLWGIIGTYRDSLSKSPTGAPRARKWLPTWHLKAEFASWKPFQRLVPLPEASQHAYDELQGSLAAEFAARDGKTPLRWIATALCDGGKTPVYGARPYSSKLQRIPVDEFRRCTIEDDLKAIRELSRSAINFGNLHLLRSDLNRRIREIRTWGAEE
jgi:hypothetical protein